MCRVIIIDVRIYLLKKKVLVPKQNKKTILILIKPKWNENNRTMLLTAATGDLHECNLLNFFWYAVLLLWLFILHVVYWFCFLSACFLIACLLDATNSMFLRSLNGIQICVQLILYCLVFGDLIKKQKKSIIDSGRGKYTFKYNRNNQSKRRNKRPDLVKLLFVFLHWTGCFTFLFKPENSTISKYDIGF